MGGYTTDKQSEEEEEEAGAGQGTRGGVHHGQTVRGGGGGGGCRQCNKIDNHVQDGAPHHSSEPRATDAFSIRV